VTKQRDFENTLATVERLLQAGQYAEAESLCRSVLVESPESKPVWNRLAKILLHLRRPSEAAQSLQAAIDLSPEEASHWRLLGTALLQLGCWNEAANACRKALSFDASDGGTWTSLGVAEWRLANLTAAEEAYRAGIARLPPHPPTLVNYARLLMDLQRFDDALGVLETVVTQDPQMVTAWLATGDVFQTAGKANQATAAYRRALELVPNDDRVQLKVASVLAANGPPDQAEPLVQTIVENNKNSADVWALLALLRHRQVRVPEAIDALRKALSLRNDAYYLSNLLLLLQYSDDASAESLFAAHREWDRLNPVNSRVQRPAKRSAKPLRVGILSSDFREHPAAFLVLPALEHLDRQRCELFCYCDNAKQDLYTDRFRAVASNWRVSSGMSHDALAQQIRADEIDILVDLIGHTGKRLLVFNQTPAPFQVTWFGYVGTTGMSSMDFILADNFHIRPDEERFYSERVLRLQNCYACYAPPAAAPNVNTLPALRTGRLTFGSFNNPCKFSAGTFDAWAKVMHSVPDAQLLLKYRGLEQVTVRDWIKVEFAQRGVMLNRLLLEPWSLHHELLQAYSRVDLALDTQPYSGGLTTCEALWMGVPTITWQGPTFASRHAASYLANAGYHQFIANDADQFVEVALDWANRLDELAALRLQARATMKASAVCDARAFAADLLTIFETIHQA
jgi:predicted O-linked N-acetylglucosamine transferase (SPINDLY family)